MAVSSGENLRNAMRKNGWSKTRLAKESGLSYATITRMMEGNFVGYVDTWVRACNTMGIGLTEILQGGQDDGHE